MKNNKNCESDSNKFHELGSQYQTASLILRNQVIKQTDCYTPALFLLRHALELFLKALIIKQTGMSFLEVDKNINFKEDKRMTNIHSIKLLWYKFKEISISNPLYNINSILNEKDLEDIEMVIERYDRIDYNSIFYRYPLKNNGQANVPLTPVRITRDELIVDEIKAAPYYIVEEKDSISRITSKSVSNLKTWSKLFNVAEKIDKLFYMI